MSVLVFMVPCSVSECYFPALLGARSEDLIAVYEVSGLAPGESALLRDLVRPAGPIHVFEKSGAGGFLNVLIFSAAIQTCSGF